VTVDAIGGFGVPGAPPKVSPVNLGYQINIELFNDELDPILRTLRRTSSVLSYVCAPMLLMVR